MMASGSGGEAKPSTSTKKAKRVELKKWDAFAFWTWDSGVIHCGICKSPITQICIQCESNQPRETSEECKIAWGICNHAFHFHCISPWLDTRSTCPLDTSNWEFRK